MGRNALHILVFIAALVGVCVLFWSRYGYLLSSH
jgi:hypothetical protein